MNKDEEKFITNFLKNIPVIQLDEGIIEDVTKIKRNHKIKLTDAIIFSTAKIHHLELVTANTDDFKGLNSKVKITNPLKIK
ncbi:MAG: hypothetical protein COX07_03525 [Bacteroidetes bacterium CG23_combo_of_CG06-09_8_20_14_all_32_9]|nr:MAG: hypothetical protein COX07_03525 [Bacteroidetes bacterium CG23_combo_of_CG06-09_8_20_14_all_32_9]